VGDPVSRLRLPSVRPLQLRFTSGPGRGRTLEFTASPVRIGRSRENDIVLPEDRSPESSARHAEFRFESGGWWIVDLDSTNGTLLNGVVVRRARLEPGDRLGFGDVTLVVRRGFRRASRLAFAIVALLATAAAAGFAAWRANRGPLDLIANSGSRSAFFVILDENGRVLPVGTAFAVDAAGRLATNAHVASPLADALNGARPGVPYAMAHDGRGERRRITRVVIHPDWSPGSVENDVALLHLDAGTATTPVTLADDPGIAALKDGTPVAIYGFPAAFTDTKEPRGSIAANVVREVQGTSYMIVGIAVAPGSSGSPVFGYDGRVVGIVAGSSRIDAPIGPATASPAVALTTIPLRHLLAGR
jgi:hypothetical protein